MSAGRWLGDEELSGARTSKADDAFGAERLWILALSDDYLMRDATDVEELMPRRGLIKTCN